MPIDFTRDEGTLIIHTAERVDSTNAQRFLEDMDAAIEPTDQVVILDMENLTYISSAGLRVILQTAKTLQRQNSGFALCALSGTVREVFEISGFDQVIDIHSSQADAISALKG